MDELVDHRLSELEKNRDHVVGTIGAHGERITRLEGAQESVAQTLEDMKKDHRSNTTWLRSIAAGVIVAVIAQLFQLLRAH